MRKQSTQNIQFDSYSMVFRDYMEQFIKNLWLGKIWLLVAPFTAVGIFGGCAFLAEGIHGNWLVGLPILYTMVSGAAHSISLPLMLYLIPCSRQQRENYIQRMLIVKIAVPVAFGCLCDGVAACMGSLSAQVFLLQMAVIVSLSCLNGMLNEGSMMVEKKAAFGSLLGWTGVLLVTCNLIGVAMAVICMDSVSWTEFWIVLSVLAVLLLPMLVFVGKRWGQIRKKFANYEMAVKMDG